jgi:hypothetical protein
MVLENDQPDGLNALYILAGARPIVASPAAAKPNPGYSVDAENYSVKTGN